ncbi:glutamine synthetase [Coniochaeta sp. 2T2.1]|nr:glutamine synthetase [Coniochaeta sp. 2T2.1]
MSQPNNLQKYMELNQKGRVMVEYIWIDSEGGGRSKSRTLEAKEGGYKPKDLPICNFDGSSTGQAPGDNSDVYVPPPRRLFADPFRTEGGTNILALCDCYNADGTANKFNARHEAAKIMSQQAAHEP